MMQELQDKFASQLDPWDDYLYGSALVVIGKLNDLYTTALCVKAFNIFVSN